MIYQICKVHIYHLHFLKVHILYPSIPLITISHAVSSVPVLFIQEGIHQLGCCINVYFWLDKDIFSYKSVRVCVFLFSHFKSSAFCLLCPMSATVLLCYVIIFFSCLLLFHLLDCVFPQVFPQVLSHSLSALFKPQFVCKPFSPAGLLSDLPDRW